MLWRENKSNLEEKKGRCVQYHGPPMVGSVHCLLHYWFSLDIKAKKKTTTKKNITSKENTIVLLFDLVGDFFGYKGPCKAVDEQQML